MPDIRTRLGTVRPQLTLVAAAALLLILAACGDPVVPGNGKGRVSGTIVVGASGAADGAAASAADPGTPLARRSDVTEAAEGGDLEVASGSRYPAVVGDSLDFVPGEVIVRYADNGPAPAALPAVQAAGATFALERSLAGGGMRLYVAPGLDKAKTLAAARELNARPDVLYAHPNYIAQPAAVPNDPFYGWQWHYDAINMAAAWDITTGSSDVVVAVLDTGIIDSHPDFAGRLLPGYDFITNPGVANDGDGRDPDPYDTVPSQDYHGTHVAGTIGAASNNGLGVSGVDWNAKVLPLRVLGDGGGAISDIIDAMYWAVGGSAAGVPPNTNPADVLNLSLGLVSECPPAWQDAIDVASQFAVVVAAAGNVERPAADFAPANCSNLITVGATDFADERAPYSNYGSAIDVMAPGGDLTNNLFNPGRPDGVFSTWFDGSYVYAYMQGTSMAAPHVSGIVALMKAIDPTVDFVRALAALRASATPLSDAACDGPGASRQLFSEDCGAGLIDAALALQFIADDELPVDGALSFQPTTLNLGRTANQASYTITNVTASTINWTMDEYIDAIDNPAMVVDGSVFTSSTSGQLAPGASQQLTLSIDRELLSADGFYRIWLVFEVPGEPEQLYQVRFQRSGASAPSLKGPMIVAAFQQDALGNLVTSGEQQSANAFSSFDFQVEPGMNLLGAWSDEDDDGLVNAGDYIGFADDFVNVPAGGHASGLTLRIDPVIPEFDYEADQQLMLLERLRPER